MRIGSFPNPCGSATFAPSFFDFAHNMHSTFRRRTLALAALATALFAGGTAFAQDNKNSLKVGVSVGNGEQIFEVVKKVAAKDGLNIQVVVFNDYQLPNAALASGDLDANAL